MSERGTFVTSYLYDPGTLVPVLRRELPKIAWGAKVQEFVSTVPHDVPVVRMFSGMIKAGYPGEETAYMETFIEQDLLPALPKEFGEFEIMVVPEAGLYSALFAFKPSPARALCFALDASEKAVIRP